MSKYVGTLNTETAALGIEQHRLLPSPDYLYRKIERVNHTVTIEQVEARERYNRLYQEKMERYNQAHQDTRIKNRPIMFIVLYTWLLKKVFLEL